MNQQSAINQRNIDNETTEQHQARVNQQSAINQRNIDNETTEQQ